MSEHESVPRTAKERARLWFPRILAAVLLLALFVVTRRALIDHREDGRRTQSRINLKMIALAASSYDDVYRMLPPWGTVGQDKKPLHGWQLLILPYVEPWAGYSMVDQSLPWDHPRNRLFFREIIPDYLNPGVEDTTDERGFGLSHYAGNSEILNAGRGARIEYHTQGQSHTVLYGEVADGYQPWGRPDNTRTASAPLNSGPTSFGRYSRDGAFLCMADGSVRFVANSVDAAVLPKPTAGSEHVHYSTSWTKIRNGLRAQTQRDRDGRLVAVWIPFHNNGDEGVPFPKFHIDDDILSLEPLDHLESLHVEDAQLTDTLLKRLGGIRSLQYLGGGGDEITDAGLAHLERLQNLQMLQIVAPRVTEAGIQRLHRALPKCVVRHTAGTRRDDG